MIIVNCLFRYQFERDGRTCTLRIKECRPDDECEYACGVDDKKSSARLFVEGALKFAECILFHLPAINELICLRLFHCCF